MVFADRGRDFVKVIATSVADANVDSLDSLSLLPQIVAVLDFAGIATLRDRQCLLMPHQPSAGAWLGLDHANRVGISERSKSFLLYPL